MATTHKQAIPTKVVDAIFTVNGNWEITSFNKGAEKLLGLKKEEMLGKNCQEAFSQYERFTKMCSLYGPLASGRAMTNFRMVIDNPDTGTSIAVIISAIPIPDDNGNTNGAVITFSEVEDTSHTNDLAMDSVADGVFTVDRDWHITSFNKAAETITGWLRKDVLGQKCHDIFHSSMCGDQCSLAKSIQDKNTIVNHTLTITTKDGHKTPISISAAPLLDPGGNVIGGVETFRDITTTMKNDLILDSVADGVFTVNKDWQITSFNRAAEAITGWKNEEVVGKRCSDIFHSSVCGDQCILNQSIALGKEIIDRTIFVKHKDGSTVPVSISAAPLLDHEGNVIGGVETFRDITDSIKNDMIIDSVADGVFTVDRNWQITSFNRAAETITGWHRDDAIGNYCSNVFHSSICGKSCAIAQSMYSGKPVTNRSISIETRDGKRLPISISAAPLLDHEGNVLGGVETFRDLSVLDSLRKQLTMRYTFDEIISKSPSMQRIFNILPEIARSPSNVLILGDSGTGKELVARAIYNASSRSNKPFVTVNCGALPDTLLESELFGYKAGAFTDAKQDKKGRFAAAEGGTIFLDEIGDIPASLQVKLLRVLQQKIYEPLGSNEPVKADVRIITATNRDLQALVKEDAFREDLFYRLNVVKIQLPPLRERMEDIPLLIEHFTSKFSAQQGKDIVGISDEARAILMHYNFPGNIRELENIIEYAFILCPGGFIQPEHLPEPFAPSLSNKQNLSSIIPMIGTSQSLEDLEKTAIATSLIKNNWKKMATCRDLGISKDTLRRKISKYNLSPADTP
ncbi:MAG: sigma 54-interacting transcriptional regulator [Proteobacteria bacterium]|nr:sigma 54-interacting transcriptional regulator [Pseudomonadota bacterium]MBU1641034.1 sigma 54-interacting transcriptional regulator [Pseudomonadota bacterium]